MIEMHVKSLPLKDVIKDLSKAMHTTFVEDCDVYILHIPPNFGKGQIYGINFPSGLGLICYDCEFKEDMEIAFSVNSVHPAKFLYVVEGLLEHNFEYEADKHYLTQYKSAIVASNDFNGHVLHFKRHVRTKLFSLEVDRKKFSASQTCSIKQMANPLKELLNDSDAKNIFYHEGGYSLDIFDLLRKIVITSYEGLSRHFFLLSASAGVLHQQLDRYELDITKPNAKKLNNDDMALVQRAINLINESMRDPVNIDYLAKTIGTNSPKLQHCFKLVYGTTVNGYIKKARIEKAAELLTNSHLSVTEIITEVGLINRGYFSKLFKEQYGLTPKAFRSHYKSM